MFAFCSLYEDADWRASRRARHAVGAGSAIEAAIQAGRQKIDAGFERGIDKGPERRISDGSVRTSNPTTAIGFLRFLLVSSTATAMYVSVKVFVGISLPFPTRIVGWRVSDGT
jgi:hypothetical protein